MVNYFPHDIKEAVYAAEEIVEEMTRGYAPRSDASGRKPRFVRRDPSGRIVDIICGSGSDKLLRRD